MQYRASSLGSFMACPYKYKHDKWDFNVKDTYFWDIIHMAARWYDVEKIFEYYVNNIYWDFKFKTIWNKLIDLAHKDYDESKDNIVLSESKMILDIWWVTVEWTPDRISVIDWELIIDDHKTTASHSWYEDEHIWEESFQHLFYPLAAMEYLWYDKSTFRFKIYCKKTWRKYEQSKQLTKDWARKQIEDIISSLIISDSFWEYECKDCRYCWFCWLKKEWRCPLKNSSLTVKIKD